MPQRPMHRQTPGAADPHGDGKPHQPQPGPSAHTPHQNKTQQQVNAVHRQHIEHRFAGAHVSAQD